MTVIVPFEAWHVHQLQEWDEDDNSPLLEPENAAFIAQHGGAFTFMDDAEELVVACGGTVCVWGNRRMAWAFFTPMAGVHMRAITRFVKLVLEGVPGRVELTVRCDYPKGHRWAKMLGFHVETPLLEAFGPSGEDHVGYAKINRGV